MEKHIRILGVLFIVRGVLFAILGIGILLLFAGGVLLSRNSQLAVLLITIATVFAGLALVKAIPEIIAGWALLAKKRWSRVFGIIMACLDLVHVPVGTALGVYALWVLFNAETQALLTN